MLSAPVATVMVYDCQVSTELATLGQQPTVVVSVPGIGIGYDSSQGCGARPPDGFRSPGGRLCRREQAVSKGKSGRVAPVRVASSPPPSCSGTLAGGSSRRSRCAGAAGGTDVT